jgi:hypothetical protein
MDLKKKLVELINQVQDDGCNYSNCHSQWDRPEHIDNSVIADHLIANGVTVQEWISVKDRLPEIVSTHKRYRSTIKKSIRVLCVCVQKSGKTMVKEGYCEWYNDYPDPRWQIPGTIDEVTHWQHLPQPPKGE